MNALLHRLKPSACQTYAADVSKNNRKFSKFREIICRQALFLINFQ